MSLVLEALTTLQCGKTNDVKIPKFMPVCLYKINQVCSEYYCQPLFLRAIVMASVVDTNDG